MNIIIFGPPGAGKGTQCKILCEKYGYAHISTGDIIRQNIVDKTDLGLQVKEIVASGGFPDDNLVNEILDDAICSHGFQKGFLFDGCPRTIQQAAFLDSILAEHEQKIDACIFIDVEEDVVINRILNRVSCNACGNIFVKKSNEDISDTSCPSCKSSDVVVRADDNYETALARIRVYKEKTADVVQLFSNKKVVHQINGGQSVDQVSNNIYSILNQIKTDK